MRLQNYRWFARETKIEHFLGNNRLEEKTVVTIGIKDKDTGVSVPHPITHFIRQKYQHTGKSLSSQMNPAREIVKFLNFINEQLILGKPEFEIISEKGFRGLQLIHGARYITYCAEKKLAYKYVKDSIERYLIHFYDYLTKMELLDEEIEFDTYVNRQGDEVIITPFYHPSFDTQYPSTDDPVRNKLKDFGDNPEKRNKLVYEFIEEARRVAPDIAFGIALQIFAGLRRGEVVNLIMATVPTDFLSGSNHLAVLDNQYRLFKHLKNTIKEQVKRPRLQPVLPSDYLRELYEAHMKMNAKVRKKNPYAFFVDEKGRTISGGTYERKFAKVKYAYIDRLANTPGRYSYFKMLDDAIWGTHIGRGIFTNYLYNMGLDDRQMAIARGDKSTLSAKAYIDYRNAIFNFQEAMEVFSTTDTLDVGNVLDKKWNWEVFSK
ncbi:site-specific integrase [Peribacillus frigoritolerans]|uniref:site-specific integrase n=1 Tax=Peribacillus frigoritolerans TaxID=450367 RepID=UPI00207AE26A|nr:site-specific integrase [Peribacillus frigoritolerans]USK80104.1 site-specific integrase [Peribacillus frigoritolerans]